MAERKLYIDVAGAYTRVALMQGDEMIEFGIERAEYNARLVGNVYRGKVVNVLPGMQAAFVDIGRERNAFLYVADMPVDRRDLTEDLAMPETLSVRVGQEILCQVIKDEVGTKGARVSMNISIVGRFLVGTPTLDFHGVSRKIEDEEVRAELLRSLRSVLPAGWGGIARTHSPEATRRQLAREAHVLRRIYDEILLNYEHASVGQLLYSDGDLILRVARDVIDDQVVEILVNNADAQVRLMRYFKLVDAALPVTLYPCERDMFGDFRVTAQVRALLDNRVRLKSGGMLYIDKTEALTVIDVNSSRFVGDHALEETVFAVNLEAAEEIARQLRLRNIGGIIVVDFIDMAEEDHRFAVLKLLGELLKKDRVKTRLVGMTALGLVQITRKKTKNDVSSYLQEDCPHCHGTGLVIKPEIVVPIVAARIRRAFKDDRTRAVLVTVHASVAAALTDGALAKECVTEWGGKRIYVVAKLDADREDVTVTAFKSDILTLPDNAKLLY